MKNRRIYIAALLVVALGAGCANVDTLADGSALRGLVAAQTADPGATARNGSTIPTTDPDRAGAAIEAMRGGVTKPGTNTTVVGN
jgi:hypothetical protein